MCNSRGYYTEHNRLLDFAMLDLNIAEAWPQFNRQVLAGFIFYGQFSVKHSFEGNLPLVCSTGIHFDVAISESSTHSSSVVSQLSRFCRLECSSGLMS